MLLAMVLPDPTDERWEEVRLMEIYEQILILLKPKSSLFAQHEPFTRERMLEKCVELIERNTPQFPEKKEDPSPLDDTRFWENIRQLVVSINGGVTPEFLDCFAGGGTLPLEARRLGMKAYGSDINPLPLAINTFQLSFDRAHRLNLEARTEAEALRINQLMERRLGHLYPTNETGEIIAILRARCIPCASCNVIFPLLRSLYVVDEPERKIAYNLVERDGKMVVHSLDHQAKAELAGTVDGGKATCPKCQHEMENNRVQAALTARSGDTLTSIPLATVLAERVLKNPENAKTQQISLLSFGDHDNEVRAIEDEAKTTKSYGLIDESFEAAERDAMTMLEAALSDEEMRSFFPLEERLPEQGSMGTGVQQFGMVRFYDLYTVRQLLCFSELAREIKSLSDPDVKTILGFALAKLADQNSSLAGWQPSNQHFPNVFGMNAIQMSWDFYELNPFQDQAGARWMGRVRSSLSALPVCTTAGPVGLAQYADARDLPFDDDSMDLFAIDPPYYSKVPYNYLSNYYLIWLNRVLELQGVDEATGLASNEKELIEETSNTTNKKSKQSYTEGMAQTIKELSRVMKPDGIGCLVFGADLDGWNSVLEPLVNEGLTVTASWPILSERASRQRARDSSVNNASIHLILRKTSANRAEQRSWEEVRKDCMEEYEAIYPQLSVAGISGGDLTWACIGPLLKAWSKTDTVQAEGFETELPLVEGLRRMQEEIVAPVVLGANKEVQALAKQVISLNDITSLDIGEEGPDDAWAAFCKGDIFDWTAVLAYLGNNEDALRGANARAGIHPDSINNLRVVLDILIPSLPTDHKVRRQLDRFSAQLKMGE